MDALGVRRPDVLTRVVEYLPEIVSYVQVGAGSLGFTVQYTHERFQNGNSSRIYL
jgi:cysteinyl-tRNA synthetase